MDISVPEHTTYFSGYLDAIGRTYTDDEYLYGTSARLIPSESSLESELGVSIIEEKVHKDMVGEFEGAISNFLHADPRERLIFYLVEYFAWFKEFTNSCICKSYIVKGKDIPVNNLVYVLNVNGKYNVLVYFGVSKKSA